MSSDFPTYGRGDDPAEPEPLSQYGGYAKPTAYGPGGYGQQPQQPGPPPSQPSYGGQPGQPPWPQAAPGFPGHAQQQPSPYGVQVQQPAPPRDPRIARLVLITAIVTASYGLLVLTIQRVSLRDIAQAPGSPLNHPLRTDVIDTLGQLAVIVLAGLSLAFWLRDLFGRRKAGRQPDPVELGGLALIGIALVPLLVWMTMVLSTDLGADDETIDRLPTAYGWGGIGLLTLAAAFAIGYRALRPLHSSSVVQPPPLQPPWA